MDIVKTEKAEPPELNNNPKIDIPDKDVNEAAEQLGYAVIRGVQATKALRNMKALGQAIGDGPVHVGRAWLMVANSKALEMAEVLQKTMDEADDEQIIIHTARLQQKVLESMTNQANSMINSADKEAQGNRSGQNRATGFGPGVNATPIFPVQINVNAPAGNEPEHRDVKRVKLEPSPDGQRAGMSSDKPAKENTEG